MDRWLSYALYVLAIGCGCVAVVLAIDGFVEYLQSGRWPSRSLLQVGYDLGLVRARWFLVNDWSRPLHDVLDRVPVTLALLAVAPVSWWLAARLGRS